MKREALGGTEACKDKRLGRHSRPESDRKEAPMKTEKWDGFIFREFGSGKGGQATLLTEH